MLYFEEYTTNSDAVVIFHICCYDVSVSNKLHMHFILLEQTCLNIASSRNLKHSFSNCACLCSTLEAYNTALLVHKRA